MGAFIYLKINRLEGGEVAGYDNIKDHGFDKKTAKERRELAIKAGKASGEARRRKANFRKTLNMLLTAEIDSEEWKPVLESLGVECTLESALLMAQIKEALSGNTQAATFVAKYAGQSPEPDENRRNREADTELNRANADKLNRDCRSEDETEGVESINDADQETG